MPSPSRCPTLPHPKRQTGMPVPSQAGMPVPPRGSAAPLPVAPHLVHPRELLAVGGSDVEADGLCFERSEGVSAEPLVVAVHLGQLDQLVAAAGLAIGERVVADGFRLGRADYGGAGAVGAGE